MDGFSIHHSVQGPQYRSLSIGTRCCEAGVVQSSRLIVDAGERDVRERERDPRMVSVPSGCPVTDRRRRAGR